jgi:hypothetical protein
VGEKLTFFHKSVLTDFCILEREFIPWLSKTLHKKELIKNVY